MTKQYRNDPPSLCRCAVPSLIRPIRRSGRTGLAGYHSGSAQRHNSTCRPVPPRRIPFHHATRHGQLRLIDNPRRLAAKDPLNGFAVAPSTIRWLNFACLVPLVKPLLGREGSVTEDRRLCAVSPLSSMLRESPAPRS